MKSSILKIILINIKGGIALISLHFIRTKLSFTDEYYYLKLITSSAIVLSLLGLLNYIFEEIA
ncbi:hypothetical protein [Alkaliphilus transvaalensis]|uniref:hypothetical protein n=1 Tax=Alkaliphilus transvaalensis TaxID=114628 RepID=UPI00047E5D74|nr:hypothetical protein [Alkaliphilus transvaalensis]